MPCMYTGREKVHLYSVLILTSGGSEWSPSGPHSFISRHLLIWGWVEIRHRLRVLEIRKIPRFCRDSNPGSSSPITIPIRLSRHHIDGVPRDISPFEKRLQRGAEHYPTWRSAQRRILFTTVTNILFYSENKSSEYDQTIGNHVQNHVIS